MGNLYARLEPTRRGRAAASSARTSTPCRRPRAIEPVVEDGIVRNAAGTILGADDKAAVAVDARRGAARGRREPAARRDRAALHAEGGGRPRRRVRLRPHAARGADRLRLRPGGADRHGDPRRAVLAVARGDVPRPRGALRACIRRTGRSAIAAAARAIAELRLGRVDEESTANVGTITGGTATNIVPEWCTFVAEARSHDERRLARARPGDAGRDHVRRGRRRLRRRDTHAQELPRLPVRDDATAPSRWPPTRSSAAAIP